MSLAYHLQTDGQMEIMNKCLKIYLCYFALAQPVHWVKWLSLAKWWYNSSYHTTIRMTSYEALYGQPPPMIISYIQGSMNVQAMNICFLNWENIIHLL